MEYFFKTELFPLRAKWEGTNDHLAYKIKVAVRFRPGKQNQDAKLSVPLHQFLKVRRQKKDISIKRGAPSEFLDAFSNKLMKSPVRFPSSGKIVDRKNAAQMLRRDPHDPFDGSACSIAMLQECGDLKARIATMMILPRQTISRLGQRHLPALQRLAVGKFHPKSCQCWWRQSTLLEQQSMLH